MKMNHLQTMSYILSLATTKKQVLLSFCFILADYQLDMCDKKKKQSGGTGFCVQRYVLIVQL